MKRGQRGDTLVEVLLAFTVFGLVATLALRTMNSGFTQLLVSTQRSETQALINGQVALLRAAHDKAIAGDVGHWNNIKIIAGANSTMPNASGCATTNSFGKFYFDTTDGSAQDWMAPQSLTTGYTPSRPSESHPVPGNSMWIEATKVTPTTLNSKPYYDFYVKACWSTGGVQELKTVVRLYEI